MSLGHHQGNCYGGTNISGEATTQLGNVIHNYHSSPYDSLWALSEIVHTIRSFDHIWERSSTVFASHREAQPHYRQGTYQSVNSSRPDSKFSSLDQIEYETRRNYWIQKRCRESDIVGENWGYDELHEFSGVFIGMNQDHHYANPRPIQQFVYQLSKEAERIRNEDNCRRDITSDDIYSVAFEVVKRIWISREIWNKDWRILPGESWKNEEQPLGEQLLKESVPVPAGARFNGRNEIKGKSNNSVSWEGYPEPDTQHHSEISGPYPGQSQSPADSSPAELDSTIIIASPSPTISSQASRDRRFRKEAAPLASRQGQSESLQNLHGATSAQPMLTRSRRDIHKPPLPSPVRNENKQRSTTSIPRTARQNTDGPATTARGIPNRTLREEDSGKGKTLRSSPRKRHGRPKENLTGDTTSEN